MRLRTIQLRAFKGFDDLTIDLGDEPAKLVALVGPNGCGKSSVLDAFEELTKTLKGSNTGGEGVGFFNKNVWSTDPLRSVKGYERGEAISFTDSEGKNNLTQQSFYLRTAYRFTSALRVTQITARPNIIEDADRPRSSIALDNRLQKNYESLLATSYAAFDEGSKTGTQVKAENLDALNDRLGRILDIRISSLGNVSDGRGQLYFEKGDSKNFPFELLSSGEKEVVDLLLDLVVKTREFRDTVFAIDEPELHLNTAVQRKLLKELVDLIPETCQLWVATHSIGFLRALQVDLPTESQVVDFSAADYFKGTKTIRPLTRTRSNWRRIFQTALEDLTGLLAPDRIVYCEGRAEPAGTGHDQGTDARVYNTVFAETHQETLFVSAGGDDMVQNASVALRVLSKAFSGLTLLRLKDRDSRSTAERSAFLASSPAHRMLERRELENYLYDKAIINACATASGNAFDEATYDQVITDIETQDLKLAPVPETIQTLCHSHLGKEKLKHHLATFIVPGTAVFEQLRLDIF